MPLELRWWQAHSSWFHTCSEQRRPLANTRHEKRSRLAYPMGEAHKRDAGGATLNGKVGRAYASSNARDRAGRGATGMLFSCLTPSFDAEPDGRN